MPSGRQIVHPLIESAGLLLLLLLVDAVLADAGAAARRLETLRAASLDQSGDVERTVDKGQDSALESEAAVHLAARWGVDSATTERLTRLAFGSCSKQLQPQPLWKPIAAFDPQVWLWAGDAVYAEGGAAGTVEKLRDAYASQLLQPGYTTLLRRGVKVLGTWDDHDYGLNDAGRWLPSKNDAKDLFLNFLQHDQPSPSPAYELVQRQRPGVYSSHTFGIPPEQVKVILLDTRFSRDSHIIPSVGGMRFPLSPLVAASLRGFCSHCSIGADFEGDVLGSEQWDWLDGQLADSEAAVHIIVSSIQVQTSNPLVESWGHFPASRARLISLLNKYRPAGLLLISGDVHFAEMSGRIATDQQLQQRQDEEGGGPEEADGAAAPSTSSFLEVTSSGMTHTCTTAAYGAVCTPIIRRFGEHRTYPDAFFTGLNWGSLEIEWPSDEAQVQWQGRNANAQTKWPRVVVSIRDSQGRPQLQEMIPPGRASHQLPNSRVDLLQQQPPISVYELAPLVPRPTWSTVAWCGVWMWLSFIGILGVVVQCYSVYSLRRSRLRTPSSPPRKTHHAKSGSTDSTPGVNGVPAIPVFISAASSKLGEEAVRMARVASQGDIRGFARHVRARSFGDHDAEK